MLFGFAVFGGNGQSRGHDAEDFDIFHMAPKHLRARPDGGQDNIITGMNT